MIKKTIFAVVCAAIWAGDAAAGEWNFETMGKARALYGYSDPDSRYSYHQSRHHLPMRFNLNLLAQYSFNDDYQLGGYLDLAYGIDQQLKRLQSRLMGRRSLFDFGCAVGAFYRRTKL